MHIILKTEDLRGAISTVTRALSAHTTIAILEGIYMEAIGNEVLFKCTDLSLQIETITTAEVKEEGGIVLPGRLFTEIARRMPEEETEIRTEKNTAYLTSGRANFNVQGEKIEDYHTMPQVKRETVFSLPMDEFKGMIRETIFATAQDDSKPILTGVLAEILPESLSMIALDGYRLAMVKRAITGGTETNVVLPAKSLMEIGRILDDKEQNVEIVVSRTHVYINMEHTKIITRLLDGEFIKYRQILPSDHTLRVRVNRGELLNGIDRMALMARDGKSNLIRFRFGKDTLNISANSDLGKAEEEILADCMGEPLEIAFNARYFSDVLKALVDEYIYLDLNNGISPCVVRPVQGEEYFYLILPVRLFS